MLLMRESIPEVDIESVLRLSRFMPKQWNRNFSRIAKKIDLVHLASSARCCPRRTQWSSERALERNPNDLVLRAELTWSYDRIDQFSVYFDGHTPDVLPSLVRHNLWFIQNTPDVYLYSLGCHLEAVGGLKHLDDGLGDHAVLLEAAKRQISAYPTNLKVALALRHYFPLSGRGSRAQEAIAALQKVARIYPNNKELKNCLEHLSKFVGDEQENRRRRLKQARKARL
jgi:tetratricopeptide (TPR) repeat protein